MLIQGHDDDQLRMRDIARIEKGYEEPTRNELFFDSERAQGILIAASGKSDIVKVGAAVEKKTGATERKPSARRCRVPQSILPTGTRRSFFGHFRN